MASNGLFFPRPANASSASRSTSNLNTSELTPPTPSTSTRQPPSNFSQSTEANASPLSASQAYSRARAAARVMREPKSPFVPRKQLATANARSKGKERDWEEMDIGELHVMKERNEMMLANEQLLRSLPGGATRLQDLQSRIEIRIKDLEDMDKIRRQMKASRIEDETVIKTEDGEEDVKHIKMEEEEHVIETEEMYRSSPNTKKRLTSAFYTAAPTNALIAAMPLQDSLHLQRLAAERDQQELLRREARMDIDGEKTRRAVKGMKDKMAELKGMGRLGDFMFAQDEVSDEDEGSEDDKANHDIPNGELDEQEDLELNPYRAAYEQGYNRAVSEG